MTKKNCIIMLIIWMISLAGMSEICRACGSVDKVFTGLDVLALNYPDIQNVSINSIKYSVIESFSGTVLDGPIEFGTREAGCDTACGDVTSAYIYIKNIPRKIITGPIKVFKIEFRFKWNNRVCNRVTGDPTCAYMYPEQDSGLLIEYTPVENPHPLLDYLIDRYQIGTDACIGPFVNKFGPSPDQGNLPDESYQGDNPQDHKPLKDRADKGDPISIYNGNNMHSAIDVKMPSPFGGAFILRRYYNSRFKLHDAQRLRPSINSYGYGWTHTYNAAIGFRGRYVVYDSSDPNLYYLIEYLVLEDQTGRILYFRKPLLGSPTFYSVYDEPSTIELSAGNYEWHRSDGSIYIFEGWTGDTSEASGELIKILDPQGNQQTLAYDAQSRLETVTDQATGRVLTFAYNAQGLLDHISGPVTSAVADGIWASYGYDAAGNLTSVTYPDGSGFIYEYNDPNDPHNLTAKKDQEGNFILGWAYDAQDRGIASTSNTDVNVTIDYVSENSIDVTNAYGVTHTHTLADVAGRKRITAIAGPADCAGCGEDTVRYVYNDQGRVEEVEYINGRIDRYEDYDGRGNVQTEIHDSGGPDQVTIHYVYHPTLDAPLSRTQTSVLSGGDKVTVWDYDDDGNATPNQNPTGRVHRLIERGFTLDAAGSVVPYEYITVFEYNAKGQVIAMDDPRPGSADTVTYAYDALTGDLESITQPLVGATYFTQYDAAGNPTHIVDPNGVETVLTYDGRNRVLTTTRNGATASTTYTLRGRPDLVTDAAGRTLDFQYSPENYLERIADPAGNYQYFGYNALGKTEEESSRDPAGNVARSLRYDYGDPLHNPELAAGKPYKTIRRNHDDTADLETLLAYDDMGNLTRVTDAENRVTLYQYDGFDRLKCIEQPGQAVTDYEYDHQGHLTAVTDPEGLVTQYLYDDMGRLVQTDSPDAGITNFAYDAAGNLVQKDQNGLVTTYAYDDLGRQVQITYADDTPGVTLVYDTGAGSYLKGRLAAVYDASGERHFSYDANGYPDYEERVVAGVSYLTGYDFDAAGNLRAMIYPTGQAVAYIADATDPGRIGQVSLDGATMLADALAYKPFGPPAAMTLGNTIQVSQTFDKNYQAAAISAGSVFNRSYGLDNTGNITAITDNLDPSRSQSFAYDDLNQLTGATGIYGTLAFTYDRTGNRLTGSSSQGTDTYTYVPGTNRLDTITGTQTINFDHDSQGNLIGRTFVTGPGPNTTEIPDYTYTYDGQRTAKTLTAGTTVYHYDFAGRLIAETAAGNMQKAYVWLHGQPLAMIGAGGAVYYYHNDHLGTPQKMTDSSGAVVWAADYLPFGKADVTMAAVENNLRASGQYYDAETGLHYNYHRYYDPQLGRYLRADPIGLAGGINPFVYVSNNPLLFTDFTGLCEDGFWDIFWENLKQTPGRMWNDIVDGFNWPSNHPAQAALLVMGGEIFMVSDIEAQSAINSSRLAEGLQVRSATSPFTSSGTLTQTAIRNSTQIIPESRINNSLIPEGFAKYTTQTFQSPAGDFQVHFYKNPTTGRVFYDIDYKAVFNR